MSRLRFLLPFAFALAACGGGNNVFQPYEACTGSADLCTQGFACQASNLPVFANTGGLCTVSCGSDPDCLQDLNNFAAICVNSQCYIQCPAGGRTCPYGTACVDFTESDTGDIISLCTP